MRRDQTSLDVDRLTRCSLLRFGVGRDIGQVTFLASMGVAKFTLVDHGYVETENIGQSGYTWNDVGKPKIVAAADHIRAFNPHAIVVTHQARHSEIPDLNKLLEEADLTVDGIDDLAPALELAAAAHKVGADVLHIRTSGNSRQFIIAGTMARSGTCGCVRCRLKGAFDAIEHGYDAPDHFPSFRLVPERLNVHAAWVTLGLLHHRWGSSLPISDIGRRFLAHPAWVGLNGIDPASGEMFPIRPYREPVPSGWTCPICGTDAEKLGLMS